jgi:hypothetical protein
VDRNAALQELRQNAHEIAARVTAMHPVVPRLGDAATQGEVIRALFELTKQVEVVKKHLIRLEKDDGSTLV